MSHLKYYTIEGKEYTLKQLSELTCRSITSVRNKINQGFNTIAGLTQQKVKVVKIKRKQLPRCGLNYENSMMNDKDGHWKLLNKVLAG
jgi:ribosomal protein S27AE